MAISRELRNRIESDATSPDYLCVLKDRIASSQNWDRVAEHLKDLFRFSAGTLRLCRGRQSGVRGIIV
jgi:hypothetical protein